MTRVAVVAHNGKTLGDGLGRLRELLAEAGVDDPLWFEVPKSRKVPARVRQAVESGAELLFVWGGDGSVQRTIDTVATIGTGDAGERPTLAILPAGTANLLATNLGIPIDLEQAVAIGLHGADRVLDIGKMNGEHFAVMAGMGMDSLMIRDADRGLKDRFGRAAYVWTGARAVRREPVATKVRVDGHVWFDGDASCVLVGNVGKILGGVNAFEYAETDDGLLDVAVITAHGALQWGRDARARRVRACREVSARQGDEGEEDPGHHGEVAPLRDGRRSARQDEGAAGESRPRPRSRFGFLQPHSPRAGG
jgi:diacylglycerol kinase family enzyme